MAIGWGALIGGIAAGVGAIVSAISAKKTNERNIAFQQQENAITRAREDDAVTRRVNDLTHSGLSATLAAGSAASSASLPSPVANDHISKGLQKFADYMSLVQTLRQNQANIDETKAKAAGQQLSNSFALENHKTEIAYKEALASNANASVDLAKARVDLIKLQGYRYKEQVDHQIDKLTADVSLSNANKDRVYSLLKNDLKQRSLWSAQTDHYLQSTLNLRASRNAIVLDNEIRNQNLFYARQMGLPVGIADSSSFSARGFGFGFGGSSKGRLYSGLSGNPSYTFDTDFNPF